MASDDRFSARFPASHEDESYRGWRAAQAAALDRDYEAFRQERQARFNEDFERWRESRRQLLSRVERGMEVLDSFGTRVGVVDKVEGGHVKIMRYEEGNPLQYVSPTWIAEVDDRMHLTKSWDEARRFWDRDAERRRHRH